MPRPTTGPPAPHFGGNAEARVCTDPRFHAATPVTPPALPPLPRSPSPPPSCPQVAVLRSSGRHTVGQVAATRPGWVLVLVEPGITKDVPEGKVYRLLGGLSFF